MQASADDEPGFCVLRDPVERAVSAYNMGIKGAASQCNRFSLRKSLLDVLKHGHGDNYDVPQVAYPCDVHLCFKQVQSDLESMLNRSHWADQKSGYDSPRKGKRVHLPKIRWGATGTCTPADVDRATRASLYARYLPDLHLYARKCDADALRQAQEDAPSLFANSTDIGRKSAAALDTKQVNIVPPPYTWIEEGYTLLN